MNDEELSAAVKDLVIKFPKVERLPVDPPIAGQNTGLFSFKLLAQPVNGIYGFLKFRGAFNSQPEWESHAKTIIRTYDSKHHIYPYQTGRWFPITTNDSFVQETLEVGQQDELERIFNNRETEEQKKQTQQVREVKSREKKLMEEMMRTEPDKSSLDYYAQQVMKIQQLESWLEMMRKRKRDMLKALTSGREEMIRVENDHPEYKDLVSDRIRSIKEEAGIDADAPIDKPSFS